MRTEWKVAVSIINAGITSPLPRSRETTTATLAVRNCARPSRVVVVVVDRAVSPRDAAKFITVARGRIANSSFYDFFGGRAASKPFRHLIPQQGQELKC